MDAEADADDADDADELLAPARPFEMPDRPSGQGMCNRGGTVYPGRYGGWRYAV